MSDYLNVTYSDERAPKGGYPLQLAKYLKDKVLHPPGKLLDIGSGRGDFLEAFDELDFDVAGVDQFTLGNDKVQKVNLENGTFPFEDESMEHVFSKSVVEHLRNPVHLLTEALRVLEYGGKAVIMTPSWEHTYKSAFYIDHTHVTPFTPISLKGALEIAGFKEVQVDYFYQLPFVWAHPSLSLVPKLVSFLPLPYRPNKPAPWEVSSWANKLLRFSKEPMLLATATKKL